MTAEPIEDVRPRTATLARTIVAGLWAHDDDLPTPHGRVHEGRLPPLPAEVRAPAVTSATDVAVDDLVVIFDQRRRVRPFDILRFYTAREAVADRETVVARVTATTARTITVTNIQVPGYWRAVEPAAFGEAVEDARCYTLRPNIPNRQIGRLGALDDLRRRIAAHPHYPDWQKGYAASCRAEQTEAEERRTRWQREQERQAPLRAATQHLGLLIGGDLISWGGPLVGNAVVARDLRAPGRLRTYVAGLRSTEAIDDGTYTAARKQLDLLGL